jgi:hypothetical protein
MNLVRAVSSEGLGRIRYFSTVRRLLDTDRGFRSYFEGETDVVPPFFANRVQRDLGDLWKLLPEGALRHDPNAYLHSQDGNPAGPALALPTRERPEQRRGEPEVSRAPGAAG